MLKIKYMYIEPREPKYKELKVYDDLDEYLKNYNNGKDFVRTGYGKWKKTTIDNKNYYSFNNSYYCINYDEDFVTEKVYKEILRNCKKTYSLRESSLFRTQKNSNTRYTGDLSSVDDVIEYMKDEEKSWLPQICNEIDEDIQEVNIKIKELQNKINILEKDKIKLYDEDYLKSNIEKEYTFDSQYYKSIKDLVEKED